MSESNKKSSWWIWLIGIVGAVFWYTNSGSQPSTLLDQRRQLNSGTPSIVYTLNASSGSYEISISSDGPLDWALLPSQADLAFPHGPYDYVSPFHAVGQLRSSFTGRLGAGEYFLEVNADRHPKPVTYDIKVVKK